MNDHCRNLAPEVFAGEASEPASDGELALYPPGAVSIPARDDKAAGEGRWYGRILCGRSFCQMADLMAEAGNRLAAPGSRRQGRMMVKAMRHARLALWHAALARASLLMTILFIMFVATAVVAHETRNTVSVYENHLANPSTARAPQQSWGYTPVLYELPESVKSNLVALDRFVEDGFKGLGLGQTRSGSSSVQSLKLGAAIMSLFGLIPVVQFGLGQTRRASQRRTKAVRALMYGINIRPVS